MEGGICFSHTEITEITEIFSSYRKAEFVLLTQQSRKTQKFLAHKFFCDFCDFCVSKTIPAFPCDQTAMRKTQESSCSSVFVRGKIVGIRRVNRRFSVASAADCRNKVNGIVERNQWNCWTKSMESFNEINGVVSWDWRFGEVYLADKVSLIGK